ncbi:MAG TPA: hypothetical protein PL110_06160, partial [Candidatus Eremiobacteraeota bacterium]|nr:hypothetical protein [Candidatus Eremiobacteraeota bacterium]
TPRIRPQEPPEIKSQTDNKETRKTESAPADNTRVATPYLISTPQMTTVREMREDKSGTPQSNPEKSAAMTNVQKETAQQVTGDNNKLKAPGIGVSSTIQPVDVNIGSKSVGVNVYAKHSKEDVEGGPLNLYKNVSPKGVEVSLNTPYVKVVEGPVDVSVSGPGVGIKDGKVTGKLGSVNISKEQKLPDGSKLEEGVEVEVKPQAAARIAGRAMSGKKAEKVAGNVIQDNAPSEVKNRAQKAAKEAMKGKTGDEAIKAAERAAKKEGKAAMSDVAKKEAAEKGEQLTRKEAKKISKQVIKQPEKAVAKQAGETVAKEVGEKVGKEVAETVTKEVGEKAGKEVVETVAKKVGKTVVKEVGETATKQAVKNASKTGLKAACKSVPLLGNIVNLVFTGIDAVHAVKTQMDPNATATDKAVAWGHVATDAAGIAIPWIGAAGDVAEAGYSIHKAVNEGKK